MKILKVLTLIIISFLLLSSTVLGQAGRFGIGGGITGITFDGNGIVIGSPADSLIIEIPTSIEASMLVEMLIGTSFKIFNTANDSMIFNPNGFKANNSNAAGIYVFQYGSAGGDTARIDSNAAFTASTVTSDATVVALSTMTTGANGGTTGAYKIIVSDGDLMEITGNTADEMLFVDASEYIFDNGVTAMNFIGNRTGGGGLVRLIELDNSIDADQIVAWLDFQGSDLHASGTLAAIKVYAQTTIVSAGTEDGYMVFNTVSAGTETEKMRIDKDGNLSIGATTAIDTQDPSLTITADADNDGTAFTTEAFTINYAAVADPTAGLWTATTTQSAGFDFDMPLTASTLTSDVSLSVGAGSPSSAFHLKAIPPGAVGTGPAGQIIIQTPADDITANVFITGYDSDGSGAPEDQLWYLGSAAASNSDITFVNRQNASLTLGTNDLYRLFLENDGDVQLRKTNATAIVDGTSIAEIQFFGDDDTALADEIVGKIETIATSTWTNGNEDAKMVLNVANNGVLSINQLVLNTDGSVQFGFAPVFASYTRHLDLDIGAAVLGPNAPAATTIGTSRGLGFDADNQAIYVEFDIPSDWDGASNMNFNIHWHGTSGDAVANTEKVKWDSHYRSVAIGEAVDNGTLVTATTTFTGGASETDKETYQTVIVIVYTGGNQPLTAGDILYMQIDRDVTGEAGGGGSYSGLGIITLVELEYTSIANASH